MSSSIEVLLSTERVFILDTKNNVMPWEPTEWNIPEENYLGPEDLQHYTQFRSFLVVRIPPKVVPTWMTQTTLAVPYTFQLKHKHPEGKWLYYKRNESSICHETPYLHLVKTLFTKGELRDDRTGTGTLSIFGHQMRFDIRDSVPLLTTKFVPWRSCLHELLWFLRGDTDSRHLEDVGVSIWKGNTRREFLDNRGLSHLPEGDIGAGYGFQWRHFGATYTDCTADYTGQGTDQIKEVLRLLKEDPMSRRIVFSAWNPAALSQMALPPCHVLCQFYVSPSKDSDPRPWLSCQMYQRSQDVFLGAPFNIFSYAALTYLLAKLTGMRPMELILTTGDTHIYKDHLEPMKEQLRRMPLTAPTLTVSDAVLDKSLEEITLNDFQLHGYFYHEKLYGKMSV